MFAEFEQGAIKTEDCKEDCDTKYALHAKYRTQRNYAVYQIEGEFIVTQMKNFYYLFENFK